MKVVYFVPRGFGYSTNQLLEGLHLLSKLGQIDLVATNKVVHHGAKLDDLDVVGDMAASDHARDADLIIFGSDGDDDFLKGQRGMIINDPFYREKSVFIDGHDSNALLFDPDKLLLYFKRELRFPEINRSESFKVRSLVFGIYQFLFDNPPEVDFDQRDIDVVFIAFGGSSKLRVECARQMKDLMADLNLCIMVEPDKQPISIEEYRKLMRRSKVGISVPGAGIDTLRFWETPAHGAVLCSADIQRALYIRNFPEPNHQALYFDSWKVMADHCRKIVNDKRRWEYIRYASDKHIKCHSTTERAKDFLNIALEFL